MAVAVLMVGASGAGKTTATLALCMTYPSMVVCSADSFFLNEGVYSFQYSRLGEAHKTCQRKFEAAVCRKEPLVVVDNTNVNAKERAFYIRTAMDNGYTVIIHVLESPVDICAARNVHGVTRDIVERMVSRLDLQPGTYVVIDRPRGVNEGPVYAKVKRQGTLTELVENIRGKII